MNVARPRVGDAAGRAAADVSTRAPRRIPRHIAFETRFLAISILDFWHFERNIFALACPADHVYLY